MGLWSWVGKKREARGATREFRAPLVEQLEPRLLLSADSLGGQNPLSLQTPSYEQALVIDLNQQSAGSHADVIATLAVSSGQESLTGQPDTSSQSEVSDLGPVGQGDPADAEAGPTTDLNLQTSSASVVVLDGTAQQALSNTPETYPDYRNAVDEPVTVQSPAEAAPRGPPAVSQIIFVDSAVNASFPPENAGLPGVAVIVLDAGRDGIRQITGILSAYSNLSAIHFISHGAPGQVTLGAATLSGPSLNEYADDLTAWGASLAEEGDILLYGCSVGAGPEGQTLTQELAALTGADVAASNDPTGPAELGGDWVLETSTGPIEASLSGVETIVVIPGLLAPGDLDTTFGDFVSGGFVFTDVLGTSRAYSVAIQSDGKIVLGGYSYTDMNRFAVVRYNSSGLLDTSFDGDGKVVTGFPSLSAVGRDIAVQADGKIVLAGYAFPSTYPMNDYDFAVARYNANGSLDASFGTDGMVTTGLGSLGDYGYGVALQSDGKIVVAGCSGSSGAYNFALVRYNANGTLDTSFDGDGKVITSFGASSQGYDVVLQSDGKIVVVGQSGSDFAAARYNANGSLDTSFGVGGLAVTDLGTPNDYGYGVTVQPDGKILVAGSSGPGGTEIGVVRYNGDGSLDTSFSGDGKVRSGGGSAAAGYSVAVQSDGKIVVGGTLSYNYTVLRYNPDGSLDTSFSGDGMAFASEPTWLPIGRSMALQSDGKIVLAGEARGYFSAARFIGETPASAEIAVLGNGVSIANGATTPSATDGTDFGSVTHGAAAVSRTFTVRNEGGATLTLGAVTVPTGFALTEGLSASLGAGASDTFTVQLDTTTIGTKSGEISFSNNDSDENPFVFRITGEVISPPSVTVLLDGIEISDGDMTPSTMDGTDFGTVYQDGLPVTRTLVIRGSVPADMVVTVPSGFSLSFFPDWPYEDTPRMFTIQLNTAVPGIKEGEISFPTNSPDKNPFNFRIRAEVVVPSAVAPTEQFTGGAMDSFDLANKAVLLTPNGSSFTFATRSITALPTSPLAGVSVNLDDDESLAVNLTLGQTIPLYGQNYSSFYLGSNGYITFTQPDTDATESLADHFNMPRISALFDDLDPSVGGTVTWQQLSDRAVVSWSQVPDKGTGSVNTMQVEMYFDGRIQLAWLAVGARSAIVGLSNGLGVPAGFTESDFFVFVPKITVLGHGIPINDDDTTPSTADYTDWGTAVWRSYEFFVRNDGTATATLGAVTVPAGFYVSLSLENPNLPAGVYTHFMVRLNPGVPGLKTGDVSFSTNDPANPFNFRITGTVPADPVALVMGNGLTAIADGDTTPSPDDWTDFGRVALGAPMSRTFTVRNYGNASLTLGMVAVPTGFTLTEGLTASLDPDMSDTFTIQLDTTTVGVRTGDVSFATNDADRNPYNFRITGTVFSEPEIVVLGNGGSVADGDTTPSTADHTDFGTVAQGAPGVTRTFTVRNDGTAPLTLGTVTVPAGFVLTEGLSGSLAPSASDTFTVQLDTSTSGTKSGDISFATDDPDENPFNFRITGTVLASPDIQVRGNWISISNGDTTPSAEDFTDFGAVIQGASGVTRVFRVDNLGGSTLTLGLIDVPTGFTLTQGAPATLEPGVTGAFVIRLDTAIAGTKTGDIAIATNDPDENPFHFRITGTVQGPAPEVTVVANSHLIEDGDTTPDLWDQTDFMSRSVGDAPVSHVFTVRNDGSLTLTLGPVTVPTGFTLTDGLPASLAPGASDTFTVRLDTVTAGVKTGDVSFATNDPDENPFNFRITGTIDAPGLPEVAVSHEGVAIPDGDTTPATADGTDFGTVLAGAFPISHSFVVANVGGSSSVLTVGHVTVPAGFTLVQDLPSAVGYLAPAVFVVRLDTSTPGTFSGEVSFSNSDSDENPFNFWITGVVLPAQPEIAVSGGVGYVNTISNGDTTPNTEDGTDFGTTVSGGFAPWQAFSVRNNGTADLVLGAVTVPAGFTVTEGLSSLLAPGASDTFTVRLESIFPGTKTGEISFATNDSDENPFHFAVTGMVSGATTNLALGRTAVASTSYSGYPASNVTDGSTASRWSSQFSDNEWIYVDLGSVFAINRVVLRWEAAYGRSYKLQVSSDASTWSDAYTTTTGDGSVDDITLTSPVSGRFVRMLGTQRATMYGYSLWELEVYGGSSSPEIAVVGRGASIVNGDTTPTTTDGTDFGSVQQGGATTSQTFIVRNEGLATLTLGAVTVPAGYTLTDALSAGLAPGTSDTFTVRLDTTTVGIKAGSISFATNDADDNPFGFAITGTVTPAPEITVLGNGISIEDGDTTPSVEDGTDFGSVVQGGTPISHTFTVRNDGTADLIMDLGLYVVTGFTLTEGLSTRLAPGQADTFTVRLDTAIAGTKTGDIGFYTNDPNEPAYNFQITGVVVGVAAAEITVLGNGISIANGDTTPGTGDATDFGSVVEGGAAASRMFTVRNDGTAVLTLGAVIVPAGFTLTEELATSLAPGAWDTFTVRLDTATPGVKSGEITFSNNDANENPFHFAITGTVLAPAEVTVLGKGIVIADGDTTPDATDDTDFGGVLQGAAAISRTFTVRNDGSSTLMLGPVSVPVGFTVTEGLAPSLAPGESDTFTVRLDTTVAGVKMGDVSFSTNDPDESSFNFRITGTVVGAGNLALGKTAVASTNYGGYPASNVTDGDVNSRWSSQFSDNEWLYVDLGATYTINRIVLNWEAAYGRGYKLQVSSDASTWLDVYTTTIGDGGVDDITLAAPASGRYVRMLGTQRATMYGHSLWEFEVYGGTPTNHAPAVSSFSKSLMQDTSLALASADFTAAFTDPDAGDSLHKIKITSLPAHGVLTLNGTAVTLNQEVPTAQLGTLAYTPSGGYTGSDGFQWNGSDGSLYAAAGAAVNLSIQATAANLALGKTAAASTSYSGLPAANVTDGNVNSRWSSQFSDHEWLYVDLGSIYTINRVVLRWEAAYGRGYKLQVSNDASTWSEVYATATGDGEVDEITLGSPAAGRYVRLLGTQRGTVYGYSLYELEVYGGAPPANLALSKPAAASTSYAGLPAANATDGDTASRWSSEFSDSAWIYVDLGAVDTIQQVVLRWEAAYGRGYMIQVSNDASAWSDVYSTTTGDGGVDDITLAAPASGRYVRLLGTQRATLYGYSLWEFEVYG